MVLLCFVLDLRSLSPPSLRNLKQALLQLANFYAISSTTLRFQVDALSDKIGLCYIFKNRISGSDELKFAYCPRGNFSLRDFHHAVNTLPMDEFRPETDDSGAICCRDLKLSSVLSDRVLYSWGGKDVMKKVIVLSSCLPEHIDSELKKTLMEAAEKCVSVDFVLLEHKSSHLSNVEEKINSFLRCISDLDNCSFHTYLPDVKVFHGLVKRWLHDLKDDMEEPLRARFIFKSNLVGSVNQIFCDLVASVTHIIDVFSPCQTCRCHCTPLGDAVKKGMEKPACPITGGDLEISDVIQNSVKVGEQTILFMPSFLSCMKVQKISSPISFCVIERTNLRTVSEGIMMGASYVVIPSAGHEMDAASEDTDQPDLNAQLFRGLCSILHQMDQGLVCSSYCNIETKTEAAFQCYYILQPSDSGPMLLRRLAGLEEVLPVCDDNRFLESSVPKEIENSIKFFLDQMESTDYNPTLHERGFHQKLNMLVKESLQIGSIPPIPKETTSELSTTLAGTLEMTKQSSSYAEIVVIEDDTPHQDQTAGEDCITEEWEQLIVTEVRNKHSPASLSKPKFHRSVLSPPDANKQIDIKTSRILERLEVPRKMKTKVISPTVISSGNSDATLTKKPLIPFQANRTAEQSCTSSQLMKPNFQRLKRKLR